MIEEGDTAADVCLLVDHFGYSAQSGSAEMLERGLEKQTALGAFNVMWITGWTSSPTPTSWTVMANSSCR